LLIAIELKESALLRLMVVWLKVIALFGLIVGRIKAAALLGFMFVGLLSSEPVALIFVGPKAALLVRLMALRHISAATLGSWRKAAALVRFMVAGLK